MTEPPRLRGEVRSFSPVESVWNRPPVGSGWSPRGPGMNAKEPQWGPQGQRAGAPHSGADTRRAVTHSFWLSPAWLLGWKSLTMMPSCRMFSTNFSRCSSRWSNFSAIAGSTRLFATAPSDSDSTVLSRFRLPEPHFRFLEGGASSEAGPGRCGRGKGRGKPLKGKPFGPLRSTPLLKLGREGGKVKCQPGKHSQWMCKGTKMKTLSWYLASLNE